MGSRIRRDRWPPVDDRKWAQEGGHRGPDTRPGDDRRADREGGRRSREIDRGAIPSDACNAISRRAVCPSVRSCMPLTPLFLLPSFSHTKVNIPAIRMEYNAILSGYNRPGDALYRADLAHTSASISSWRIRILLFGVSSLIVPPRAEKPTSTRAKEPRAFCVRRLNLSCYRGYKYTSHCALGRSNSVQNASLAVPQTFRAPVERLDRWYSKVERAGRYLSFSRGEWLMDFD